MQRDAIRRFIKVSVKLFYSVSRGRQSIVIKVSLICIRNVQGSYGRCLLLFHAAGGKCRFVEEAKYSTERLQRVDSRGKRDLYHMPVGFFICFISEHRN